MSIVNLPALTGTEKQVKWAEDIRLDFARILDTLADGADILADMTTAPWTTSSTDPMTGEVHTRTRDRFTRELEDKHRDSLRMFGALYDSLEREHVLEKKWEQISNVIFDQPQAEIRRGTHKVYVLAREYLADLLERETKAKFYIDHR